MTNEGVGLNEWVWVKWRDSRISDWGFDGADPILDLLVIDQASLQMLERACCSGDAMRVLELLRMVWETVDWTAYDGGLCVPLIHLAAIVLEAVAPSEISLDLLLECLRWKLHLSVLCSALSGSRLRKLLKRSKDVSAIVNARQARNRRFLLLEMLRTQKSNEGREDFYELAREVVAHTSKSLVLSADANGNGIFHYLAETLEFETLRLLMERMSGDEVMCAVGSKKSLPQDTSACVNRSGELADGDNSHRHEFGPSVVEKTPALL